jgi:hypothetical protein
MRTRSKLEFVGSVLLLVATGSTARADWIDAKGSQCVDYYTNASKAISHDLRGAFNASTTDNNILAICPLDMGRTSTSSFTLSAAALYYRDSSSSYPFYCAWNRTLTNGTTYSTAIKYTCSTAGGCTDPTTSWTGQGYLQWTSFPSGSNVVQIGDNSYFSCKIPSNSPSGSFVTAYAVQ